jgi:hypothetical protein
MPIPQLDNLVATRLLKAEPRIDEEFDGLLRSAIARLRDAKNEQNSFDGRFDLAYGAAHGLALAALRWHGYRPDNKRYVVFQVLEHTVGLPAAQWRVLSEAHDKRNRAEYEGLIDVQPTLLDAVVRIADELVKRVSALRA